MVNTTQFYKTKVALAVVLSLGLAACGDSEGDAGSTSTSNSTTTSDATQNTTGNQEGLSGTVQGVVVDSNGTPLAGVMVYLGSQETTTNAGGQYVFNNVGVTNVNGVNNEGDENDDDVTQTLVVTIGGTADYLGALVTVTPEAQVNNTGGQGDNGDPNGSNSTTTIQTFIDGFTAEAGVAVLPTLNAGAYGFVRDCRTGQPLADTANILSLDFDELSEDVSTTIGGNGTQLTTAEDTHTVDSDADGKFSLAALASNSNYTVTAKEGWMITGTGSLDINDQFSTGSEGSSEYLSTIEVCPTSFTATDLTPGAPFIKSVAGAIGTTTDADTYEHVVLTKGTDGTGAGITLNFSEMISAADFDATDVVVTKTVGASELIADIAVDDAGAPMVTLAEDGKSMTVVLAEALGDEQRFSVWFPQWQYKDNRGNEIVTGDAVTGTGSLTGDATEDDLVIDTGLGDSVGSNEFGIISDVFAQETGKVGYIRTRLCTYVAPAETPEGLTGEQLVKTLDSTLLAVSPLWDNSGDADPTTATNLNGQESADANRDTGERLETRFGGTVTNDTAVIVGSVDNATGLSASVVPGTGGAGAISVSLFSSGSFRVTVPDTFHGTQISLTPSGAFGVSGTPITVTLEDKVAPTTILQENYELWAVEAAYSATTFDGGTGAVGGGGEVTEGVITGEAGDPLIYIQPRHLSPTTNNRSDRYEEFDSFAFATKIADGANDNSLYTGPGFAGWSDRGNSLGVAFSETIATGAVAPLQSASVTVALTGVLNGITTDVDGNLIVGQPDTANGGTVAIPNTGEDLARFTVSDMVDFANNDHDEAIDFTNGAIVDTRDNLANANSQARVVIRDAMPAFVTSARWDGESVIVTFNEAIVPDGSGVDADVLTLMDLTAPATDYDLTLDSTATAPAEGAYSLSADGTELTVAINSSNIQALFQNGPNDEFVFDSNGDTDEENHLALNFDTIRDTRGNSWGTFDRDVNSALTVDSDAVAGDDRFGRYLVDAPRFMLYNDVGIFTITKQTVGYVDAGVNGDDDGNVTLRFSFSHPIDLLDDNDDGTPGDQRSALRQVLDGAQVADYDGSLTLTDDQANAMFQYDVDGGGAGAPADFADVDNLFRVTFSTDLKVVTLDMSEADDTIVAGTSRVDFQTQVDSVITDEFLAAENYTVVNSN